MTKATEDYLKTIYHLHGNHKHVETSMLARRLNVAASSATVMAQRLAKKGLVNYQPYAGVTLTRTGQKQALDVVRRHRLLECWLVEKLGVPWEKAHAEAEHLEHAFSDELVDRMEAGLEHPATSPYGSPIPSRLGHIVQAAGTTRLSNLPAGQQARVAEVSDYDAKLLSYFAGMKLCPGAAVTVLTIEPFGGSLQVEIDRLAQNIGCDAAKHVFVTISQTTEQNSSPVLTREEEQRTEGN